MSKQNRGRVRTRRCMPIFEGLEERRIPSGAAPRGAGFATLFREVSGSQSGPAPLKRAAFVSAMAGRYFIGHGRLPGQALQTYLVGAGTASAFLHGDFQLAFATPSDPSAPAQGLATFVPKNNFFTGSLLILELESDGPIDPRGRTTRFTWTVNDASSGTFANAMGQGTLQVRFLPSGRGPRPAIESGRVATLFRGTLMGPDTGNLLRLG